MCEITAKLRPSRQTPFPYLVLSLSICLAWLPLLLPYIPFWDDYYFVSFLKGGGVSQYFKTFGAWRPLGMPLTTFISPFYCPPGSFGAVAIFTHIFMVFIFFNTCRYLLYSTTLSFILSLIMAIFPWAWEAMAWSYHYVLATTFFWCNLLILIRFSTNKHRQGLVFLLSYMLTWLSLISNETLFASLALSGCVVWIFRGGLDIKEFKERMIKFYSGWAPPLATLSFLLVFMYLNIYGGAIYGGRSFSSRPRAVLSTYFYQWTNILIFEPWLHSVTRRLVFYDWNKAMVIAAAFLFPLFVLSLFLLVRKTREEPARSFKPNKGLLLCILALMFGASYVYAVVGGFSLDTRKRYPLIPLLMLFLGWLWIRFFEAKMRTAKKFMLPLILGLSILGFGTTWINLGVWRHSLVQYNALINFLCVNQNEITSGIRIHIDDPHPFQGSFVNLLEGPIQSVERYLSAPLAYEGCKPVRFSQDPRAKAVRFNKDSSKWEFA